MSRDVTVSGQERLVRYGAWASSTPLPHVRLSRLNHGIRLSARLPRPVPGPHGTPRLLLDLPRPQAPGLLRPLRLRPQRDLPPGAQLPRGGPVSITSMSRPEPRYMWPSQGWLRPEGFREIN